MTIIPGGYQVGDYVKTMVGRGIVVSFEDLRKAYAARSMTYVIAIENGNYVPIIFDGGIPGKSDVLYTKLISRLVTLPLTNLEIAGGFKENDKIKSRHGRKGVVVSLDKVQAESWWTPHCSVTFTPVEFEDTPGAYYGMLPEYLVLVNDTCNHEFIPLFTSVICKHCGCYKE